MAGYDGNCILFWAHTALLHSEKQISNFSKTHLHHWIASCSSQYFLSDIWPWMCLHHSTSNHHSILGHCPDRVCWHVIETRMELWSDVLMGGLVTQNFRLPRFEIKHRSIVVSLPNVEMQVGDLTTCVTPNVVIRSISLGPKPCSISTIPNE